MFIVFGMSNNFDVGPQAKKKMYIVDLQETLESTAFGIDPSGEITTDML